MDKSNNNCNNNTSNDPFFKLWRNIVINRIIFKFTRLYNKNKQVVFRKIQSLREYSEKEFITKLVYQDNTQHYHDFNKIILSKEDFPQNGVLKELDLNSHKLYIPTVDIIPQTVEILRFCKNRPNIKISPSELSKSVNTISNLLLKSPYIDQHIPTNITSLSFNQLDPTQLYDIKFPNSIVYLDLQCLSYSGSSLPIAPTTPSFIPSSVSELITCYHGNWVSNFPAIPPSVTKLGIYLNSFNNNLIPGYIPFGVKHLFFRVNGNVVTISKDSHLTVPLGITKLSKGCLPESITKISRIDFGNQEKGKDIEIEEGSIPNTVLDLKITFTIYPDFIYKILPNSLTRLDISCCYISEPLKISELPSTLKYLKIDNKVISL